MENLLIENGDRKETYQEREDHAQMVGNTSVDSLEKRVKT